MALGDINAIQEDASIATTLTTVVGADSLVTNNLDLVALHSIIADLSRRLQNAQHTIQSQKDLANQAHSSSDNHRKRITDMALAYRLETAKNSTNERKQIKLTESAHYEESKAQGVQMHQKLRTMIIDQEMTKSKLLAIKIDNLKDKIVKFSKTQDSQRLLLQHLGEYDVLVDELCQAAQFGDLQKCLSLLQKGAAVNEVDSAGYLPIHYACVQGNLDVVKLLLEYGSDPTSYITGKNPLEVLAKHGHVAGLKLLLDFGADLNDAGSSGLAAILAAAQANQLEVVKALLDLGCDIHTFDIYGNTALHFAVQLKDPVPMIRLLLSHGADTKRMNQNDMTPLKLAYSATNGPAIEALGGRTGVVSDAEMGAKAAATGASDLPANDIDDFTTESDI